LPEGSAVDLGLNGTRKRNWDDPFASKSKGVFAAASAEHHISDHGGALPSVWTMPDEAGQAFFD